MLNAIIIDDEQKSCENLKILLEDFCKDVYISEMANTVANGIAAIQHHRPDVVFLDIQMQKETGFDLLKKIPLLDFEVIFVTAYSEFAIEAIKFSALDYLLKPIDINDLQAAVLKVEKKLLKSTLKDQLEILMHNFKMESGENYKLAIPNGEGLVFIEIKNLIYCEAQSNYTKLFMKDGKNYLVSKTLKEYDNLLSKYGFYRIHHTFLINTREIKKYVKGDGGYVVMSNDQSIDVSKRKKDAFLKSINISNVF
ncbi:MAG TPA: LytTR family DNA-binding domain-containing protein [Cytophagaceae bacterium]|jgi:two-component system LytT family response regulator|nr:LytTR family DNA-binding domain-containing protein [Cytophagaceae bacterium]